MRKHLFRRPSAGTVLGALALFVALGGTTYAATGGNFILGQANTATTQTSLSANTSGAPTLNLINTGGRPAARFQANGGKAVFAVSNSTKIPNLNADMLDGIDSNDLVKGQGNVYSNRVEDLTTGITNGDVLTVPNLGTIRYHCDQSPAVRQMSFHWQNSSGFFQFIMESEGGGAPVRYQIADGASTTETPGTQADTVTWQILNSHANNRFMATVTLAAQLFQDECVMWAQATVTPWSP